MNDDEVAPTSLSLLQDIVVPEPVSWWPLAPALWAVLAVIFLCAVAAGWFAWRRWKTNAYRRAALRELESLSDDASGVPALLKRTALAVWPRSVIAGLSGDRWIAFLREASPNSFDNQSAEDLLVADYGSSKLTAARQQQLIQSARVWISTHTSPSP